MSVLWPKSEAGDAGGEADDADDAHDDGEAP